MNAVSGDGPAPSATLQFLVVPVSVQVSAQGQRIHVVSSRHLGTSNASGADGLQLWICHQNGNGPVLTDGLGAWAGKVPANTTVSWSLSYVLNALPPGVYKVGLCGKTIGPHPYWNANEYGYTSAIVAQVD